VGTLGTRLKRLRERAELSQLKAAEIFGISNVQLSRYESDKNKPDPELLAKFAGYYEVSVDYLVTGTTTTQGGVEIDPEWLELYEEVKSLGLELEAKAFLRTTTKETVSKDVLRDVLKVFQHIASQQKNREDTED
jgi:HTH-type transcriptional regulator, competence development regulator